MTVYEPALDWCVPEELPTLRVTFSKIDILSPNAAVALAILSIPVEDVTWVMIESAYSQFLAMGVGKEGMGPIIIQSGELGAYMRQLGKEGLWVDAYWGRYHPERVVDVTGRGVAPNNTAAKRPPSCWKCVFRWLSRRFGSWKGNI